MVKEAKVLTGKLNHIAFSTPWLKYLLGIIYTSLAMALCINNAHLVRTSKRFRDVLRMIRIVPQSPNGDVKRSFHSGETTRAVHGCRLLHHIRSDLRCDLCLIKWARSSGSTQKSCPIAYLIPWVPFSVVRSNSSLTAASGYCPAAKFWW